jgi:toxin ParE1/3/4
VNVRVLDPARDEIAEAADYYDAREAGSGTRFIWSVMATVGEVAAHPEAWAEVEPGIRRRNVKGFPYAVIYQIVGNVVEIGCVMHGRRRPGYWKGRF